MADLIRLYIKPKSNKDGSRVKSEPAMMTAKGSPRLEPMS